MCFVPTARPPKVRAGSLNLDVTLGQPGVVIRGNRSPQLLAKRARRKQLDLGHGLAGRAPLSGQRVARAQRKVTDRRITKTNGGDRVRPDVSRRAVADTIAPDEACSGGRLSPQHTIAESQVCLTVVVDFHDEVPIARAAFQEI